MSLFQQFERFFVLFEHRQGVDSNLDMILFAPRDNALFEHKFARVPLEVIYDDVFLALEVAVRTRTRA